VQGKEVSYLIIDSVYDPKEKSGMVLRQEPEAESKVKHNRTVYLYVTGMVAPQIKMPKLIDRSERQARLILVTYGLKVGTVSEKRADCNGCVLSQRVKGKEIAEGNPVKKGSVVDLVVGRKDSFYSSGADDNAVEEDSDKIE
jgi:beta-lactam-binding protein with PASTA domain